MEILRILGFSHFTSIYIDSHFSIIGHKKSIIKPTNYWFYCQSKRVNPFGMYLCYRFVRHWPLQNDLRCICHLPRPSLLSFKWSLVSSWETRNICTKHTKSNRDRSQHISWQLQSHSISATFNIVIKCPIGHVWSFTTEEHCDHDNCGVNIRSQTAWCEWTSPVGTFNRI